MKNRSNGKVENNCGFRAQNIQQLIQQQWLRSTNDTTVAVTRVDVLHLHPHHRPDTSTDLSPATTIDYRGRVRVVGTSTRAVACAFASEPQPSPTLQKHQSKAA